MANAIWYIFELRLNKGHYMRSFSILLMPLFCIFAAAGHGADWLTDGGDVDTKQLAEGRDHPHQGQRPRHEAALEDEAG